VLMHSREVIAELEQTFLKDQLDSIRLESKCFGGRPFMRRLVENGCRLLSPVL
jgi:hypothetical protein